MQDNKASDLEIFQLGGAQNGPLPTVLYFALSGHESLHLDPINQPVQFLKDYPVRIISFTLPKHGAGLTPDQAIAAWKEDLLNGIDPLDTFIPLCQRTIDTLYKSDAIDPTRFTVMGLSRGALAAVKLAALDERITHILGFAPLIDFSDLNEVNGLTPYTLFDSVDELVGRPLKFLIGNHDTRVGTDSAYTFIRQLTLSSIAAGIRSPDVELAVKLSIGYKGHGTAPGTFKEGALWLLKQFRLA